MRKLVAEPNAPPSEQHRVWRNVSDFFIAFTRGTQRFWLLVVAVGLVGGLSAVVLVRVLEWVQALAWTKDQGTFLQSVLASRGYTRFLWPVAAGGLVLVGSWAMRQPLRGHGTAAIIESIWARSGRMAFLRTVLRGFVSIIAVGLGAPLGREGALLQIGAASGSGLGRTLKLPPERVRLLVACGASAGIAAAYNVPIGAALFGLEVLLGSFALELFGPIVLACVVATLVSRVLIANHPSYLIPTYHLEGPRNLVLALVMGPLLGLASALYVKLINAFSVGLERSRGPVSYVLPLIGMSAVGIAALWFPELLGNGYDSVNAALLGRLPLVLLVALPVMKAVATALAAGSGVPGGLFTPSLFYGALTGGALGAAAQHLFPGVAPAGAFALLGMGAVLAGTTHASVSAVLIIFELTGDYDLILPLMLCAVTAAAVARWVSEDSLYTAVLKRRNVRVPELRPQWMRSITARMLVEHDPPTCAPDTPFDEVVAQLLELPEGHDLYIVDSTRRLLGVIALEKVKAHIPDHTLLSMTVASDVMTPASARIREEMSLTEVAKLFDGATTERLPVVDRGGHLLGTLSKGELLRHGRF